MALLDDIINDITDFFDELLSPIIQIKPLSTATHPPGTIITQRGGEFPVERGKENQSPYGYEEFGTPVESLPPGYTDTDDLPTVKDPRIVQADQMEAAERAAQLAYERGKSYPPLSPQQIARELQRHPIGWDASPGMIPLRSYPGFTTRPDGLLQWNGQVVPPMYRGTIEEGIRCTSGAESKSTSPEDLVHCAMERERYRNIMELLRNRPWYPGYDVSPIMQSQTAGYVDFLNRTNANVPTSELVYQPDTDNLYGLAQSIAGQFLNPNRHNEMFAGPSPMITAQEELLDVQTRPDFVTMRKQERELRTAERTQRLGIGATPHLDADEGPIVARRAAEAAARKAKNDAIYAQNKAQGRAQQLAELQRWTQQQYAFYSGSGIIRRGRYTYR